MIKGILVFILFLGPLVFIHELGHFLLARFFKVRVEVFSLGFGPKILKYKHKFTQYAVSLIPLGGYVKMFGDDPSQADEIKEEDRQDSFIHKGKNARFWIVLGGPLANFILAYFIYFSLQMTGEILPIIRFGFIPQQTSFYELGLRTGDTIKKINNIAFTSPAEIDVGDSAKIDTVSVLRNKKLIKINVNLPIKDFFKSFSEYTTPLRYPLIIDGNDNKYALSLSESTIDWKISLDELSEMENINNLFIIPVEQKKDKSFVAIKTGKKFNSSLVGGQLRFWDILYSQKLYPYDLIVKSVSPGAPAQKAGILKGDKIIKFGSEYIYSFEQLRRSLQESSEASPLITVSRGGNLKEIKVTPQVQTVENEKRKMIGIESSLIPIESGKIATQSLGFFLSAKKAFFITIDVFGKTINFIKNLVTGEISIRNIGGPVAISSVATSSFDFSLTYFFRIMALMSINLGLINLFPIPVLDGGHIAFILFELVNRKPLSQKKMAVAQQIGLSLLLLLMIVVFYNDFSRLDIFSRFF